ncbi:MAG: O-antigen ligase family protein [Anaerolineae bacterium]|jgi:O-antigen ligase
MERSYFERRFRGLFQVSAVRIALALAAAAAIGIAVALARPILGQYWWLAFIFAGGLAILPIVVRQPARWLFVILALSLPFSARFRITSQALHAGGAEAAIAPLDFALLALFVLYVLEDLRRGKLRFYNGPVERRLLLFGFVGLLTAFNAADASFVLYEVLRILRMIALIYCIRRFVRGPEEVRLVVYLLAFNVVTQSLMGLAQLALGRSLGLGFLGEADILWLDYSVEGGVSRVGGTLGHANSLAMFLEMLLPLFFSLAVARDTGLSTRQRLLAVSVFVLGLAALLMTYSRSSWISLFVALALVLIYHFRHLRFSTRQLVVLAAGGFASLAALVVFWEPIYRRLTASSALSFSFRANLNAIATNMVEAHPWLGVGLNNFVLVMPDYDHVGLSRWRVAPAHNIYFLTVAETGILGLLAFLWLLLGVFAEGWRALKSKDPLLAACAAGLLAGLAATLVHGLLGWGWRYDVLHVTFWFLAGCVLSLNTLSARPAAADDPALSGAAPAPGRLGEVPS